MPEKITKTNYTAVGQSLFGPGAAIQLQKLHTSVKLVKYNKILAYLHCDHTIHALAIWVFS